MPAASTPGYGQVIEYIPGTTLSAGAIANEFRLAVLSHCSRLCQVSVLTTYQIIFTWLHTRIHQQLKHRSRTHRIQIQRKEVARPASGQRPRLSPLAPLATCHPCTSPLTMSSYITPSLPTSDHYTLAIYTDSQCTSTTSWESQRTRTGALFSGASQTQEVCACRFNRALYRPWADLALPGRANTACLLACYMILIQSWPPHLALAPIAQADPPLMPFRDAGYSQADYVIGVQDVVYGVWRAKEANLCGLSGFDLEE